MVFCGLQMTIIQEGRRLQTAVLLYDVGGKFWGLSPAQCIIILFILYAILSQSLRVNGYLLAVFDSVSVLATEFPEKRYLSV
jgi:hypothetical protein